MAALRANDLADELAQLDVQEPRWRDRIRELREFANAFRQKADQPSRRVRVKEWSELLNYFQAEIDGLRSPLPESGGTHDSK